jgi:hypothetical protein
MLAKLQKSTEEKLTGEEICNKLLSARDKY